MDTTDFYRIGIPLGTRLQLVVRRPTGWEVWTALGERHLHPDNYLGTFLFLHDDGSVIRVTRHPEGFETQLTVKGTDNAIK